MTTADAILVFAALICSVIVTGMSFYFKRPLMWIIAGALWIFSGVVALSLSTVAWDTMYYLFWVGVGIAIVCIVMVLQTRGMEKEEEAGEEKDDSDSYNDEAGGYGEKQEKLSKATGGRRGKRR